MSHLRILLCRLIVKTMNEWSVVSVFLKKFKKITPPEYTQKKIIQDIIYNCVDILVPLENIKNTNTTIFLDISSVKKTQIFINKEKIIFQINNNYSKLNIQNIK